MYINVPYSSISVTRGQESEHTGRGCCTTTPTLPARLLVPTPVDWARLGRAEARSRVLLVLLTRSDDGWEKVKIR